MFLCCCPSLLKPSPTQAKPRTGLERLYDLGEDFQKISLLLISVSTYLDQRCKTPHIMQNIYIYIYIYMTIVKEGESKERQ